MTKRLEVADVDDKRDGPENHIVVTFTDGNVAIYGGRLPDVEHVKAALARAQALERWEARQSG